MTDEQTDERRYRVVLNHEEQYSIWAADKPKPPGWNDVGKQGTREECLDYIEQVWTDMRPLSVRKHLAEIQAKQPAPSPTDGPAGVGAE